MKKEQRSIFVALADEIGCEPCLFCKYGESMGCDCGTECKHPLNDYAHFPGTDDYGMEPGQDCWAFRPLYSLELTADIVGVILATESDSWSWYESKDGKIIVKYDLPQSKYY